MNIKELKSIIGTRAEDIISIGLGLNKHGSKYSGQCPLGGHNKPNPSYEWIKDHFFCHDCHQGYDIIDFCKFKSNDWYDELCSIAGVEKPKKTEWKQIKPVTRDRAKNGIDFMKQRGISLKTLKRYHITTDDDYIYFNYVTVNDKLVATKIRKINPVNKNDRFTATAGGTSIFYGMHLFKKQKILIICEGEIDAISLHEIIEEKGVADKILCSSLPNGAGTLPKVLENCGRWLDLFESIIVIPDKDDAGKDFEKDASRLLGEYDLGIINLPCNDVNEYFLDDSFENIKIMDYFKPLLPKLEISKQSNVCDMIEESKAYSSGYVTLDYNFAGLQEGWLTILTGSKGEGKTTFARQILLSLAMQGIKSFMFCGESLASAERDKLARLASTESHEIVCLAKLGGAKRYRATPESINKFNKKYGELIYLADMEQIKSDNAYDGIFKEIKKLVKYGVKVFVIDNLMKLTLDCQGGKVFDRQKKVIADLKLLVDTQKIHIVLIAHPNGTGEKISGVEEIVNTCDGIVKFTRLALNEGKRQNFTIPAELKSTVSSVASFQKARDDGTFKTAYFEWSAERGALINVSTLPEAKDYEHMGYWTRAVSKYENADRPARKPYKEVAK